MGFRNSGKALFHFGTGLRPISPSRDGGGFVFGFGEADGRVHGVVGWLFPLAARAGAAADAARAARPGNSWGCPREASEEGLAGKGLSCRGNNWTFWRARRFLQLSPMGAQCAGVAAFTAHGGLDLAVVISQLQKQAGAGVHLERNGQGFRAGLADHDHFAADHALHLLDAAGGGRAGARDIGGQRRSRRPLAAACQ